VSVVELLGWAGNACFFSRFLVQWAASERARRSVATPLFWWLSLAGSLALGIYTLERAEPVLLAGYVLNGAVYARNLLLQRRGAREPRPARPFAVLALLGAAALTASVLVALPHGQASAGWIACAALGQAIWRWPIPLPVVVERARRPEPPAGGLLVAEPRRQRPAPRLRPAPARRRAGRGLRDRTAGAGAELDLGNPLGRRLPRARRVSGTERH
jgi:lipid-A-disaccharide synthase-like uncharacterized protein